MTDQIKYWPCGCNPGNELDFCKAHHEGEPQLFSDPWIDLYESVKGSTDSEE